MKKHLFALLALVLLVTGCPSGPVDVGVDAQTFAPAAPLDAQADAAPHRVGSFNPTCTGTGVPKVTSGVQASACGLISNTDVANSAGITGDKVLPAFVAQNITTTGYITLAGSPTASAGSAMRLPNVTTALSRDVGNTKDLTVWETDTSNKLWFGGDSVQTSTSQFNATTLSASAAGLDQFIVGANVVLRADATNVYDAQPVIGYTFSPYSTHGKVTDATAGTFTLASASYQFDAIMLSGGTAGTVTFPAPSSDARAYYKTVINTSGVTKTLTDGGASTPALVTATSGHYLFDLAGVHLTGPSVAYP